MSITAIVYQQGSAIHLRTPNRSKSQFSGKTKTPQTVTLQVKIERGQKAIKKSARRSRPCSYSPPAPKFPSTNKQSDSVKRHLRGRHLCVLNLKFDFISDGGVHPRRTNCTLTKAASIPARRQRDQGFLDLFFDAAPHLEYFFQFLELSTKAAFAKAAFDTL